MCEAENNNTTQEVIPSMDDFKEEIDTSFHKWKEGDMVKGTVIGVTDSDVSIDLGSYAEGVIPLAELSNDPSFSIKADIAIGDSIDALVLSEDNGEGALVLSKKKADDILAWDTLKEAMQNHEIFSVKIKEAVKGGVVTYLKGVRAFIPASQISLSYVEDLSTIVGQTLDIVIITVEKEKNRLVLSAKEVLKDKKAAEKTSKLESLQTGIVTEGTVEKIVPYGAFVAIGDNLTGLVHISQICGKRIQSPHEVIKEGDKVKVKILEVKDGKIRLSMKAVEEKEEVIGNVEKAPVEYHSKGSATTTLGSLLKGIKLD